MLFSQFHNLFNYALSKVFHFKLKVFSFNEQLNLKCYSKLLKVYLISIKKILEIIVYLNIKSYLDIKNRMSLIMLFIA